MKEVSGAGYARAGKKKIKSDAVSLPMFSTDMEEVPDPCQEDGCTECRSRYCVFCERQIQRNHTFGHWFHTDTYNNACAIPWGMYDAIPMLLIEEWM